QQGAPQPHHGRHQQPGLRSMRYQSLPGVPLTSSSQAAPGSTTNGPREVSMIPESIFPQFGHYSNVALAALQGTKSIATSGQEYVDPNNFSSDQNPGPCLLRDFYQNPVGTAPSASWVAWQRTPDSQATTPGGDNYLKTGN